jgi:hypothetical protein
MEHMEHIKVAIERHNQGRLSLKLPSNVASALCTHTILFVRSNKSVTVACTASIGEVDLTSYQIASQNYENALRQYQVSKSQHDANVARINQLNAELKMQYQMAMNDYNEKKNNNVSLVFQPQSPSYASAPTFHAAKPKSINKQDYIKYSSQSFSVRLDGIDASQIRKPEALSRVPDHFFESLGSLAVASNKSRSHEDYKECQKELYTACAREVTAKLKLQAEHVRDVQITSVDTEWSFLEVEVTEVILSHGNQNKTFLFDPKGNLFWFERFLDRKRTFKLAGVTLLVVFAGLLVLSTVVSPLGLSDHLSRTASEILRKFGNHQESPPLPRSRTAEPAVVSRRAPSPARGTRNDLDKAARFEDFIREFMSLSESDNLSAILELYANEVRYYDRGLVDKNAIRRDKLAYMRRWPVRKYKVISAIKISASDNPDVKQVEFQCSFQVQNDKKSISGVSHSVLMVKNEVDKMVIIKETGETLNRASN